MVIPLGRNRSKGYSVFRAALSEAASKTQKHLIQSIRAHSNSPLSDAMEYAVQGGKGIRGFFVLEGAKLYDVDESRAICAAAAIEALHAYSLVHDDLPCMDDDELRRGKPTVHRKWDEATAVLTGDCLQSIAFRLLASSAQIPSKLIWDFANAAELMVRGQEMDIAAESTDALTLSEITELQAKKTGALISWSCTAGPALADQDDAAMSIYGQNVGLAFQIADDVLDVEGDAQKTGKRVGKDTDAGKATFVSLLGVDGAKTRAKELVEQAEAALDTFGEKSQTLRQAARFVISRES